MIQIAFDPIYAHPLPENHRFPMLKKRALPVAVALGGGYSPDIKTIVEAHCNTFRLAVDLID
jgi:hypothetical protein